MSAFWSFVNQWQQQNYRHHCWRRKQVFWIKSSRLWDHHGPRRLSAIQPDHWHRRRVEEMLIQLGLRLLANVWMQEKEMDKLELWLAKLHEIRRRWINIDAWCSHAVKVYGQCFRCCSRFHHRLVSCTLTQIQKIHSSFTFISTSITVYSFCNLCWIKLFANFPFVMQPRVV